MNKALCLLLALLFVGVQSFSIHHMAEHAFCKHTHNGRSCDFESVFVQAKITSADVIPPLPVISYYFVKTHNFNESLAEPALSHDASPRAPPFNSFA